MTVIHQHGYRRTQDRRKFNVVIFERKDEILNIPFWLIVQWQWI